MQAGLYIPQHWHDFAADILHRAVMVVDTNDKAREGPLAEAMGLQGSKGNFWRDNSIVLAIQQADNRLSGKQGHTGLAQKEVFKRLRAQGWTRGLHNVRSIWKKRLDIQMIERVAKEMPECDFLKGIDLKTGK